jgi:hypothetical protein
LSRQWQGDNNPQGSFFGISRFNLSAVVGNDGSQGCQARTHSTRIAISRAFRAENRFKNTLLERFGDAGAIDDYLRCAVVRPD